MDVGDRISQACLSPEPLPAEPPLPPPGPPGGEVDSGSESGEGGSFIEARSRLSRITLSTILLAATATCTLTPNDTRPSSLAVLPLVNVSVDPEESDYLAQGISRAVISKLTQAGLRVTPWTTVRRYEGSDEPPGVIARELNVDAALVGTFELVDDRILTSLSLVEVETGLQTWSDEFRTSFEDVFEMQRRIAEGTVASLELELTSEGDDAIAAPESRSVEAYESYLQGAHLLQEATPESTEIALQYFTRAVELDPTLVEAHVGIGAAHNTLVFTRRGGASSSLIQAEASFDLALELDPASMSARRGLIEVEHYRGRSEACLRQGQLAARMGRPDAVDTLLVRAAAYAFGGLPDRALPLYRRVIELDALNPGAHYELTLTSLWAGEFEPCVEAAEAYRRRFGADPEVVMFSAMCNVIRGDLELAKESIGESFVEFPSLIGLFFDRLGERDQVETVCRRGLELTESRLQAYPDDVEQVLTFKSLSSLLTKEAPKLSEEEWRQAVESDPYVVYDFAAVQTKYGGAEEAIALMREMVRRGRQHPYSERVMQFAGVTLPDSESFRRYREEYRALEQRLREAY